MKSQSHKSGIPSTLGQPHSRAFPRLGLCFCPHPFEPLQLSQTSCYTLVTLQLWGLGDSPIPAAPQGIALVGTLCTAPPRDSAQIAVVGLCSSSFGCKEVWPGLWVGGEVPASMAHLASLAD